MTQTIEQRQSPREAEAWCAAARAAGKRIGFVPTMGALHEGHLSLVQRARRENDLVVVSIFVNPLQFGEAADLEAYPRDFEADAALLAGAGCDLVFTGTLLGEAGFFPEVSHRDDISSEVAGVAAEGLEGEFRAGHFEGVATIVRRLFELTNPHRAYFGAKDYQQTLVIQELASRMAAEGCATPAVTVCPIARDASGLALSSRNLRLSETGKSTALALSQALTLGRRLWRVEGLRDAEMLQCAMESELLALGGPGLTLEYLALRDPGEWAPAGPAGDLRQAVGLVAAQVDGVRLIDNMRLDVVPLDEAAGLVLAPDEVAAVMAEAPAKINPWLEVHGRRASGFHDVDLTMVCIDLVDHLRLAWVPGESKGSELSVTGPAATADIPLDGSNLVIRAAALAIESYSGIVPPGYLRIELCKRIPSRAGLGGGSSDAAAALLGTLELLEMVVGKSNTGMSPDERAAALASLGSDCPFFLEAAATGFGRCTGRGELVEPLHAGALMERCFEVVVPRVECSTAAVYGALEVPASPRAFDESAVFNRLTEAAFASSPELAELAKVLEGTAEGRGKGSSAWHLSGSGSTLWRDLDAPLWLDLGSASLCGKYDADSRYEGRHRPTGFGARVLQRIGGK